MSFNSFQLKKLTDLLEEERSKKKNSEDNQIFQANGPEMQLYEIQSKFSFQLRKFEIKISFFKFYQAT